MGTIFQWDEPLLVQRVQPRPNSDIFFFQISGHEDSDTRLKVNVFSKKSNTTSVRFSIEILVKAIKLVLTFNDEIEYGDKAKSKKR